MQVEDVFSSKTRMKILLVLTRLGQLDTSGIARRVGANYETTKKHLDMLESEGLLQHRKYGRINLYRLDPTSEKTKAVQNLLAAWEQ